jgi:hypothetical protein
MIPGGFLDRSSSFFVRTFAALHSFSQSAGYIGSHDMDLRGEGTLGGICGYAKSKYAERVEDKKQKRSCSEPPGARRHDHYGKLHKPPKVPTISERPRNRLRKNVVPLITEPHPTTPLFILEYEPYPHLSQPSKVLGVYSTFDSVTLGALKHGAYTFSREGLLDGSEYLSSTGRIKLVQTTVQQDGVKAIVPERTCSLDGEHVRLDIPHPQSREEPEEDLTTGEAVFLATRQGPNVASWVGVFSDESLAWGACLKDKAMCAATGALCDEQRSIGTNNMPQVSGRIVGSGRYTWLVEEHAILGLAQCP